LPNIYRLVDEVAGNCVLSFLEAYSKHNKILMAPTDMVKTSFIIEEANYYYKVMPFGLKNVGTTYQRLMDKVFSHLICKIVEVYVDDIMVKSANPGQHLANLTEVSLAIRKFNLWLNSEKCVFRIDGDKFLGFMLTKRGIYLTYKIARSSSICEAPTMPRRYNN